MKICNKCEIEKPLTEYRSRYRNKNGSIYYDTVCKRCNNVMSKARHKANYTANPNYYCAKTIASKIPNRLKVIEYLKTHPCVDCGNSDFRVLEFDHRDPQTKLDAVSSMLRTGKPWSVIEREIDKCDVRCANCHRIKTAIDYDFYSYLLTENEVSFQHVLEWYNNTKSKSTNWHSKKKCLDTPTLS